MPMYNLTEYRNTYSKTSESLWQCYRDEPNDILTDYESFIFKVKITGSNPTAAKDVKISVSLKYWINFGITLELLNVFN